MAGFEGLGHKQVSLVVEARQPLPRRGDPPTVQVAAALEYPEHRVELAHQVLLGQELGERGGHEPVGSVATVIAGRG